MAIFSTYLPAPSGEKRPTRYGCRVFAPKMMMWRPFGYHLETVLDTVTGHVFSLKSKGWISVDTVDTINSNSYAREEITHIYERDEIHTIKISRARLNRKNGIHYIQKEKKINKLNTYKNTMVSKMVAKRYPDGIQQLLDQGNNMSCRIWWVSRLLVRWFRWRNQIRNRMPCALNLENDVVDSTRKQNDLINASGVDFQMIQLDRVIDRLDPSLKEAVYAVYGQNERNSLVKAASILNISRSSLKRRLMDADRAIEDGLRDKGTYHEAD